VSPLNKKLWRDLWRVKGQAVAIGLVIALGVMMLVMMSGLFTTLNETRKAYYERYRLADIFAPSVRAPKHVLSDLGQIPGVQAVEGRISGSAMLDLPDVDLPLRARALSLPAFATPRLNALYLSAGRWLDPDRSAEILLLKGFADARGLAPGDHLLATMNGGKRRFLIVGIVQGPEFLYTTPPGEIMPDDARSAVIWLNESALAAAFDLNGAFNEALFSLGRNADEVAVINAIDRLLKPYGGIGAYGVADQMSNRFVSEEISGLQASAIGVPPIFLAIAAFLLYIVITRMVQSEREQIGLLKAFGYYDIEVALHYFKLVLVITIGGAAVGSLLGVIAGQSLASYYQVYFKFPFLIFQLDPNSFVTGFLVSVLAASAGGVFVLRRVFALTPAVAMHPPAPPDYSRSASFGPRIRSLLDQPTRMILRRVMRQPGRMGGAILGVATGMALSAAMISVLMAFDRTLDLNFAVIDRSHATLSFTSPLSDTVLYDLGRIKGVEEVEPIRGVPVLLRNGLHTYRGSITGMRANPRLNRALDKNEQPITLPARGIILAQPLADILQIGPGETLIAEVQEGRRPNLNIPVVGIAQTLLGSPTYMEISALNRALREPNRISGAFLRFDAGEQEAISARLKAMPTVAGVSLKADSRAALERAMNQGAGATRFVMAAIAAIITFGIVYNTARIAFAESARDLASLRVIGFTKAEAAYILLGEIGVVTLLALPLGALLGYYLSFAISSGFSTDIYQIPVVFAPSGYGIAALAVLAASLVSGWLVKRDVDRLDLISVLKTRE
jgi:putative ABC transport system permease protein